MDASHQTSLQQILRLAADVDPSGDRTIGVLTKPDLVKNSERDVFNAVRKSIFYPFSC
jgi:hypothetical protein